MRLCSAVRLVRDQAGVARLDAVVELLAQTARRTPRPRRCTWYSRPHPVRVSTTRDELRRAPTGRPAPTRRCGRPLHLHDDAHGRRAAWRGTPDRSTRRRSGRQSNEDEHLFERTVELLLDQVDDVGRRRGPHVVLQERELPGGVGPTRGRCGWTAPGPSFTNMPPHSSSAMRRRRTGGRPPGTAAVLLAAESERRAEAVAHRDARDLRRTAACDDRGGAANGTGAAPTTGPSARGPRCRAGRRTRSTPPPPSCRAG